MMKSYRALISTALLCLVPLHMAAATAYKWIDENGETHYSQSPPTATKAEVIKTPTSPADAPAPEQKPANTAAQKPVDTKQPLDNKAKAEDAAVRAENCASASKDLETLQNSPRVTVKNKDGLYHRLNDEERKARIEETQKRVDEFCAP